MTPQNIYVPLREQKGELKEFSENGVAFRVAVQSRGVAIEIVGPCAGGRTCESQGVASKGVLTKAILELEQFQRSKNNGPLKRPMFLSGIKVRRENSVRNFLDGAITLVISKEGAEELATLFRWALRSL
jgi:hypothetical protein